MRHLLLLPLVLSLVSGEARAQAPARYEFGVDVAAAYQTADGDGLFSFRTPVDVRIGFVSPNPITLETRFSMTLASGGGITAFIFDPGVNVLFKLGQRPAGQLAGPYVTVGADVAVVSLSGGGTSGNSTTVSLNGGIGTRVGSGASLTRYEGFLGYTPDGGVLTIGIRAGLSFFK